MLIDFHDKLDCKKEKFRPEIYFSEGISAFEILRNESKDLLSTIIGRLIIENPSISEQKINDRRKKSKFRTINIFLKSTWSFVFKIYLFIKLCPSFVIQKHELKTISKNKNIIETLILTLSPRLNSMIIEKNNIREHLSLLAKEFSYRKGSKSVTEDIKFSQNLLVFDPVFSSSLWKHKKIWLKDNVIVIDINFIIFFFITSIFKINFGFIKRIVCFIRHKNGDQFIYSLKKLKVSVCAAIILFSYEKIIKKHFNIISYYFTSNSFATELLRLFLICHSSCNMICEILHGVPTVDYERYINNLIELGNRHHFKNKLSFISQIPGLPQHGGVKNHFLFPAHIAINTYLNNYIINIKNIKATLNEFIAEEYDLHLKEIVPNNALTITFMGGAVATGNKKFFLTETFTIEKFIISHIKRLLISKNIPYFLIYAPHPLHDWNEVSKCNFFTDENIFLYRKTIFTWLMSDVCISLYSSALFEASFFGAKTFTPLKNSDKLYSEKLLNLLNYHRAEHNTLKDEIDAFILSCSRNNMEDIKTRIMLRAKNFPFSD